MKRDILYIQGDSGFTFGLENDEDNDYSELKIQIWNCICEEKGYERAWQFIRHLANEYFKSPCLKEAETDLRPLAIEYFKAPRSKEAEADLQAIIRDQYDVEIRRKKLTAKPTKKAK